MWVTLDDELCDSVCFTSGFEGYGVDVTDSIASLVTRYKDTPNSSEDHRSMCPPMDGSSGFVVLAYIGHIDRA